MDKRIELIEKAISDADKMQSKHGAETYDVPALSSLKLRNLMNNLGSIATNYLECGPHKAGLFSATIKGNENLKNIYAVDSFESDMDAGEPAEPIFLENVRRHKPANTEILLIKNDCFKVDLSAIKNPIDLYLYDAGHERIDQEKALTYYRPILADAFIFCCDDWQYGAVKQGTLDGIMKGDYEVLYEKELLNEEPYTEDEHRNMEWWRGFYVALLKKNK